jgi:hypothetical protein
MRLLDTTLRPSRALIVLTLAVPLVCAAACTSSGGGGTGGTGTSGTTGTTGTTGGTGGGVSEAACDPLAPPPITLGAVVGVGKDAAGTLYVDAANGVFVSSSGKLLRQHVTGSGESGTTESLFTFEAPGDDGSGAQNLLVETTGAAADAMELGPAGSKAFLNQSPPGVTALTLVAAGTVSAMPVVNTPNVIEYVADVANGDVLVATLPMNDDSTSDDGGLAIFYGPPNAVAQRAITAFDQSISNDGSVTFDVGGTPYVLAFGTVQGADAGPLGQFVLQGLTPQGGAEMAVTLRSPTPTTVPAGLSFTCLP